MLRKLMKHEFRATGRIMLPLYLVLLVSAVGANISARGLLGTEFWILDILGGLLLTAFVVAIAGVCVMSFVLMIQRFYKNLLQDEGYVMMTLPVSVHQQVWSKILVSVVWFAVTAVVVVLAFCIMAFRLGIIGQAWFTLRNIMHQLRFGGYIIDFTTLLLECLAVVFLACCAFCLEFYAALAIGHGFAGHKLIWSVAVFFGIQFVMNLLGGGLIAIMDATGLDYTLTQMPPRISSSTAAIHLMTLGTSLLVLAQGVVYYFLTTYFLQKRLNLE